MKRLPKFVIAAASAVLASTAVYAGDAATNIITPQEQFAASQITEPLIRAHIKMMGDDLFEGRGPASRGDALTQLYLATQMEAMGLKPGAPDGSWLQPFDIVGLTSNMPEEITFTGKSGDLKLKPLQDFVAGSGTQGPTSSVQDAEVVFVGYGIQAPEYGWDDYKGMDVRGKVLLMMNNDPADRPQIFEGKKRLYYGRWTYKYEIAAKLGAAAAIIIHTTPSASYPWQVVQTSWTGEQFELPQGDEPRTQINSWATEDASRKIAALGGFDLDALRKQAESKNFRPVNLGVKLNLQVTNTVTRKSTANVIGKMPGSDPVKASEAVIYTAHHDHLGIVKGAKGGKDEIYNGALDNASGVAQMLAIAKAATALPVIPKRTLYFAAVAAEEQGLLGSEFLAKNPPVAAGRIAANINMDGAAIFGKTRDITLIGLGKSNLDETIKVLTDYQGRTLQGDQFPDKGSFYRSDQFNFAKIGVPAAYFSSGTDIIGKPSGYGVMKRKEYTKTDYHQPSDEYSDSWDLSGAVEDAQLMFYLGNWVANQKVMPAWYEGDEFAGAREAALQAVR